MTGRRPSVESGAGSIRARAEERLRTRLGGAEPRTGADAARLLHELEVHQIELEIQNAELERTRGELEASLERYTDLYDFAPVGNFTLDRDGVILSANLTGAGLLGVPRGQLLGRRLGAFVAPASRPVLPAFLASALDGREPEACELTLVTGGGGQRTVRVEATAAPSGKGCRAAVLDVTDQKAAEAEVRRVNEGLELLLGTAEGGNHSPLRPVLVLLDLQLPGIGGIEVLRRLRADARTRTIPVIVLTSSRVPKDVTTCYELGANSYLQKPVELDPFLKTMETLSRYWLRMNVAPGSPG